MLGKIGAFIKANKLVATGLIAGSTVFGGTGGLALHYYFSTQQMMMLNQQGNIGQLRKQISKTPVNTNRVIYNVPPKGSTNNSLSNAQLNKEYQEVIKAIEQITGQPYTIGWMANYLGQNQNNPWVQWYFEVFPYAVIGYQKTNELPSIAMTVAGLVCKTGTTGDAVTYHNIFGQTAPNSKDAINEWQYSSGIEGSGTTAVGGGSSGGSTTLSVMPLKWRTAMGSAYNQKLVNAFNWIAPKVGIPAWFLAADCMKESNFTDESTIITGVGYLQFNMQGAPYGGQWAEYWRGGSAGSMQKFINDTCGIKGSSVQIYEKFISDDINVQIAVGAWEMAYKMNYALHLKFNLISSEQEYNIGNVRKYINFNKFFAGGVDEERANWGLAYYNGSEYIPSSRENYWNGVHLEALVLFGVPFPAKYQNDPGHAHPLPSYKQYADITEINPAVTGKSVNTTVNNDSNSSNNSSASGLVKYPNLGTALLSEELHDSKQGDFGSAVSSSDFNTQLSNLANINLLHNQNPSEITSIYNKYNVAKLDKLAQQVKALINSQNNLNSSSQSLGPGEVNTSWTQKSPTQKWEPAGAMTILNYYHISTQGISQKVLNVLSYAGSLMGSPYVFGGKGELYQSNAQVQSIYAATQGGSYGYDNYLKFVHYTSSNGIKPNGKWRIFDCSGYVNWVLQHAAGITLGGGTSGELSCGKLTQIPGSEAKPGDLVIFFEGGQSVHVAFFLKDAGPDPLLLEAPCSGKGVMIGYYTPGVVHRYYRVQGLN